MIANALNERLRRRKAGLNGNQKSPDALFGVLIETE
jgi:hypothetical protein